MGSRFEIETTRLTLLKPEKSDSKELSLILQNPIMTMYREYSFSQEEIDSMINESQNSIEKGDVGLRVIKHVRDNRVIGFGGVKNSILGTRSIYTCYMYLLSDYWGQGYGKEALSATINDAFNKEDIKEVHSFIGFENYAMQYLLESLGFLKIGDETINLDYNIVSRAHYVLERETKSDVLIDNSFFFPLK